MKSKSREEDLLRDVGVLATWRRARGKYARSPQGLMQLTARIRDHFYGLTFLISTYKTGCRYLSDAPQCTINSSPAHLRLVDDVPSKIKGKDRGRFAEEKLSGFPKQKNLRTRGHSM
jgi:hypothetical protein